MKSKSEILEQQENAQGYKITEYVGKDGYVWQMILSAMEEYAQQQVNGVETSREPALNLAGVSASFLAHLEMQLNYHKRNEQNKREMGDYEKAMYHRDRGGAIEDLIIHIKNAR